MPEGAAKPKAFPADSITKTELSPGVRNGTVWGDRIMLSFVDFEPHSVVEEHSHQHEQMGTVLEGVLELTIGGKLHTLEVGDAYLVPPNVRHGARSGPGPCRVLDVFSPPREEYKR